MKVRTEWIADAAVVLTCICVSTVAIQRLRATPASPPSPVRYAVTDQVQLPGVDFGKSDRTLLLVLSSRCAYCTKSLGFYSSLSRLNARRAGALRIIATGREPVDRLAEYLSSADVVVDGIVSGPDVESPSNVTPALLLIDRKGIVRSIWTGLQDSTGEREISDACSRPIV